MIILLSEAWSRQWQVREAPQQLHLITLEAEERCQLTHIKVNAEKPSRSAWAEALATPFQRKLL